MMRATNMGVRGDPPPSCVGAQKMTCQGSDTQSHSDRNADLSLTLGEIFVWLPHYQVVCRPGADTE